MTPLQPYDNYDDGHFDERKEEKRVTGRICMGKTKRKGKWVTEYDRKTPDTRMPFSV